VTAQVQSGRRLDVEGLWKTYGDAFYAVRDVSFALEPGEFLTLLGPSGSGKTSTLMMVAGFETPTRGAIRVDGRNIAAEPPERRNFGIVFQGYALFPHMTVLDNVAFALRMRRVSAAERRRKALDMIDKVGLSQFAGRLPRQLSGGQQQRVALARALVFEPDALLLDEPLGALDRKLRETLQAEIKAIQRRVGISILFVTHDQDEAMTMSDRIAVMADGAIAQIGTPSEVYLHPATPFVADFLGDTNLLNGVVCGQAGSHALVRFRDGAERPARQPSQGPARSTGEDVCVSIRPERIRIIPEASAGIAGIVEGCTFLGRHARYAVRALGQSVDVSTTEWTPAAAFEPGRGVGLDWAPDDAQILAGPEVEASQYRSGPTIGRDDRPLRTPHQE
jgi:ABC-type Fe3+/spermidine/putrescine transport system ATPase subunit